MSDVSVSVVRNVRKVTESEKAYLSSWRRRDKIALGYIVVFFLVMLVVMVYLSILVLRRDDWSEFSSIACLIAFLLLGSGAGAVIFLILTGEKIIYGTAASRVVGSLKFKKEKSSGLRRSPGWPLSQYYLDDCPLRWPPGFQTRLSPCIGSEVEVIAVFPVTVTSHDPVDNGNNHDALSCAECAQMFRGVGYVIEFNNESVIVG